MVFWSKRWHQKYILKLADLYCLVPVITYCKQFCLCLPQCWFPSCFHKTHDLPQHHRQLLQRLELKWGYWVSITEMKQTKIVLRNIYYSPQIKKNYILKYGSDLRVSFLYKCSPLLSLILCPKNEGCSKNIKLTKNLWCFVLGIV